MKAKRKKAWSLRLSLAVETNGGTLGFPTSTLHPFSCRDSRLAVKASSSVWFFATDSQLASEDFGPAEEQSVSKRPDLGFFMEVKQIMGLEDEEEEKDLRWGLEWFLERLWNWSGIRVRQRAVRRAGCMMWWFVGMDENWKWEVKWKVEHPLRATLIEMYFASGWMVILDEKSG